MLSSSRKISKKKFSQRLLESNFRNVIFEQGFTYKTLTLVLMAALAIFSGFCVGIEGVYINRIIFFLEEPNPIIISLGLSSIAAILVCVVEMSRLSFIHGLWKAVLTDLVASIWIAIQFRDINLISLFFFILFPIALALLTFISSNLSFGLASTLFQQKCIYIKLFCSAAVVIVSIMVCDYWSGYSVLNFKNLDRYFETIKFVVGFLLGMLSVVTGLVVTSGWFGRKNKHIVLKHTFLKDWSIIIASWGGTSFHNLDLSEIDFTGSRLAYTDFRAVKFYRTCLRYVNGLDRARTDNRYFDIDSPKVQELLTVGSSEERDFGGVNLHGAYLQDSDMRQFRLIQANFDEADLRGTDLREGILVGAVFTNADLSRADLTGACIKDWSINSHTCFTGVKCDYIYREFKDARPVDRYPANRNFAAGEFASLYAKVTNAVELIFQDQVDWRALSFTFEKFQIEDDGMGLELKGVEQRGDYWVVKVAHGAGVSKQQVEQQVQSTYDDLRALMESKDHQINQLLGIVDNQTRAMNQQAEALTHFSQHPFGNSFFITGSTITNLAGSGQIEYQEAASSIRQLIAPIDDKAGDQADDLSGNQAATLRRLIAQMSEQNVATTVEAQKDLIQQILLSEAERDPQFRQMLLQQGEQIIQSLPRKDIAIAFQAAIAQLSD